MNIMIKRILNILLASVATLSLTSAVFAADAPNLDSLSEVLSNTTPLQETVTTEQGDAEGQEATTEENAGTTTETTEEKPATTAATEAVPALAINPANLPTMNTGMGLTSSSRVQYSAILSSISKYMSKNQEAQAWLYVPNTNINFTIINPSQGNTYYEKRSWEGVNYPNNNYKNYKETATFTDHRVVLGSGWGRSSKNIVLYGHNWTNLRAPYDIGNVTKHTMFGQLPSYTSMDFAKKNPYVYFSTSQNEGIWKVFAVAYIENDPSVFRYNSPNPDGQAFARILAEYKERSLFDFGVDVNAGDRILTLDTCTRNYAGVGGNQRFVVVARLLREGETDTQGVAIQNNPNVKYPKF